MRLSRRSWTPAVVLAAASVLLVVLAAARLRTWMTLVVVPVVFFGLESHRRWSNRTRAALLAFLALATLIFCVGIVGAVDRLHRELPEWDFLGFWIHARTAVLDLDFYDPANAGRLASTLDPPVSAEFRREIVETGFWYPPPSMFLFLPLGWFDPRTALALWQAFHVGVLALDAVLLWRVFFPRGSIVELAACVTLLAAAHGTLLTFVYAQTTFVALLALLLFWRRPATASGGAWIAVASLVKPLLAVLALGPVLCRRWHVLAGLAAATAASILASALAFGPKSLVDYFAGTAAVKPAWIYSEPTNQSLLGFILRATDTSCSGTDCVTNPTFLAASLILGLITVLLGAALADRHEHWTLSLGLLFALLAYPVSQVFYSVLLIPPLLLAWGARERVRGGAGTMAILGASVFALCVVENGEATVAAVAVLWTALAYLGLGLVREGRAS